jgi:hypothetical protein
MLLASLCATALAQTLAAGVPASCSCTSSGTGLAQSPSATCRAVGDPHYLTFDQERFDFFGRGLFLHARFNIAPCCDVVIQTFLIKLIRGWPANSAIAATAIRVGATDVTITGGGQVTASRAGRSTLTLQPESTTSTHDVGDVSFRRERMGRAWAWRVVFPGGAGSFLVHPRATSVMPGGFLYNTWLTLSQGVVYGPAAGPAGASSQRIEGLCAVGCLSRFIPRLPSSACAGDLKQGEQCYPIEESKSIFAPNQLRALEAQGNMPRSTREPCPPLTPPPPSPPPTPPRRPPPPSGGCITRSLLPGTSSQGGGGNQHDKTSPECVELPSMSGIRAISMWFQPLTEQDDYFSDYLLDARTGLTDGWIALRARSSPEPWVRYGNGWRRIRWHDMSTASPIGQSWQSGQTLILGRWCAHASPYVTLAPSRLDPAFPVTTVEHSTFSHVPVERPYLFAPELAAPARCACSLPLLVAPARCAQVPLLCRGTQQLHGQRPRAVPPHAN